MKKILAMVLAMMLVLSMSAAFAADEAATTYTDTATVDLTKIYKEINKDEANPGETFKFKVEKVGVTDSLYTVDTMPFFSGNEIKTATAEDDSYKYVEIAFAENEATIEAGDTNSVTINLPTYNNVGIFTYKFTEIPATTAGVTYDPNPVFMKVTVVADTDENGVENFYRYVSLRYGATNGDKTSTDNTKTFTNVYSAGDLNITKNVTGNLGDKQDYFDIQVKLTGVAGKTYLPITVTGGSHASNPGSVVVGADAVSFKIKHGETLNFSNIPYDVTYEVTETDRKDYEEKIDFSDKDNKKIDSALDTVTITNTKSGTPDTGISLDNAPYMILMALVVIAGAALIVKRASANR